MLFSMGLQASSKVKRCKLNSLTKADRSLLGNHELRMLNRSNVSSSTYYRRRKTIVDFINGKSNRVNSNGVVVEFYVG